MRRHAASGDSPTGASYASRTAASRRGRRAATPATTAACAYRRSTPALLRSDAATRSTRRASRAGCGGKGRARYARGGVRRVAAAPRHANESLGTGRPPQAKPPPRGARASRTRCSSRRTAARARARRRSNASRSRARRRGTSRPSGNLARWSWIFKRIAPEVPTPQRSSRRGLFEIGSAPAGTSRATRAARSTARASTPRGRWNPSPPPS